MPGYRWLVFVIPPIRRWLVGDNPAVPELPDDGDEPVKLTNAWAQRHIRIAIPAQKERQLRWATELVEALRNGTNFTIPQSN